MITGHTIHLQYYGKAPAKPAKDFYPGEYMLWNFGSITKVLSTVKETAKTITYLLEYKESMSKTIKTTERTFKKDRLVGISNGLYY